MLKLEDSYIHKGQRKSLIDLLKRKGITDPAVLEAMNTLPRHFFFDSALSSHAYDIQHAKAQDILPAKTYQLHMEFTGKVNTTSDGMYLSTFEGKNYIFTQF